MKNEYGRHQVICDCGNVIEVQPWQQMVATALAKRTKIEQDIMCERCGRIYRIR